MKKEDLQFKNYIGKQFLYYSFLPWVIVSLVFLVFASFDYYTQSKIKEEDFKIIKSEFDRIDDVLDKHLTSSLASNLYIFQCDNQRSQKIYETHYSLINELNVEYAMSIYDQSNNLVFTTVDTTNYYFSLINKSIFNQLTDQNKELVIRRAFKLGNLSQLCSMYVIGKQFSNELISFKVIVYLHTEDIRENITRSIIGDFAVVDRFEYIIVNNIPHNIDKVGKFSEKSNFEDKNYERTILNDQLKIYYYLDYTDFWSKYGFTIGAFLIIYMLFHILLRKKMKSFIEISISSIDELIKGVKEIQEGNLNININVSSFQEFKILATQINIMASRIKRLLIQNDKLNEVSNEAQIKQLVAQFNPHFLYNSLETIRYLIQVDQKKASDFVFNLTRLLRYSIDSQKRVNKLREEIIYTRMYLDIMTVRFDQKLTCSLEIDEKVLDIEVPKLMIQPLIENSIKYGFTKKGTLRIDISIKKKNKDIIITVKDDGGGIDSKHLKEILNNLQNEENNLPSFGLFSLNKRLKLIYEDNAKMDLINIENGLKIKIILSNIL